jgi:hypothetical protein
LVVLPILVSSTHGQGSAPINLTKVYRDETHCLVAPEIRAAAEDPNVRYRRPETISCYCRDALVDARYVYQTYLITGKDLNLDGVYLNLAVGAADKCGIEVADVDRAARTKEWQWYGPEVVRKYPSDSAIEQIKPDSNGLRAVRYEVLLTYRDPQGRAKNFETFSAVEKLPKGFKTAPCPPSAVCPK